MKLYEIPDPWDYHEQGAFVVMAESAAEAVAVLKAQRKERYDARAPYYRDQSFEEWSKGYRDKDPIAYDAVKEIEGPIYEVSGCDC